MKLKYIKYFSIFSNSLLTSGLERGASFIFLIDLLVSLLLLLEVLEELEELEVLSSFIWTLVDIINK